MHLLQFIEELYVKQRKDLNQCTLFQDTILVLMFLFEQMGILSLDLPDRVTFDIDPPSINPEFS